MAPSVLTTTALFSRTSRSLRPRHRTTTLMFVSSLNSESKSRSLRFNPDAAAEGVTDMAGEGGTDLSSREGAPMRLGGRAEDARTPVRVAGRVVALVRLGRGMAFEDFTALFRGAGRLESRTTRCFCATRGKEC